MNLAESFGRCNFRGNGALDGCQAFAPSFINQLMCNNCGHAAGFHTPRMKKLGTNEERIGPCCRKDPSDPYFCLCLSFIIVWTFGNMEHLCF